MNWKVVPRIFIFSTIHKKLIYHKIHDKILYISRTCSNTKSETSTAEKFSHSFGYEEVTPMEKREKVQTVFTEVASKYDLMNDVMSMGIHRFWKDYFIDKLSPVPGMKLLDVAGGTGDIAFRFLEATLDDFDKNIVSSSEFIQKKDSKVEEASHAIVFDMNDKMLLICKERAKDAGLENYLTCIQGNAESLPFEDNSFDAYTIAFGIRNVVHIDQALAEAFRVLRPGGRFLCLEFSEVKTPMLYRMYDWYSQEIIPVLGQVIAGNWKAYQYLVESIQKFPNQEEFATLLEEAGFNCINYENFLNGIAAIHSGYKL